MSRGRLCDLALGENSTVSFVFKRYGSVSSIGDFCRSGAAGAGPSIGTSTIEEASWEIAAERDCAIRPANCALAACSD